MRLCAARAIDRGRFKHVSFVRVGFCHLSQSTMAFVIKNVDWRGAGILAEVEKIPFRRSQFPSGAQTTCLVH